MGFDNFVSPHARAHTHRHAVKTYRYVPRMLECLQARLVRALFFSLFLRAILHSFLCPPWMVLLVDKMPAITLNSFWI